MSLPYFDLTAYADEPVWVHREAVMRIDERLRRCVVFLGAQRKDRAFIPYGTGFLVSIPGTGDLRFGNLITARHVLKDIKDSQLPPVARQNLNDGTAGLASLPAIEEWYTHPTIENLDIAVIPAHLSSDTFAVAHFAPEQFLRGRLKIEDSHFGRTVIQACHVDPGKPRPDGRHREEDQALSDGPHRRRMAAH